MATQIQIQSTNYNGQIADITFYPCIGATISLGNQTIPYTYTNDNYEGVYELYFSGFNKTCELVIICIEYHLQAENTDNILAENGDFIDIEN